MTYTSLLKEVSEMHIFLKNASVVDWNVRLGGQALEFVKTFLK